jgi:hypothetical protein
VSRLYSVRISHKFLSSPEVFVISPSLKGLASGRAIPHLYDQDEVRLCLYYPGSGQYSDSKPTAPQILPWTATWLYYFEEWLVSDEWRGGGIHLGAIT